MNKTTTLLAILCFLSTVLVAQTPFETAVDHLQKSGKYSQVDLADIVISDEYQSKHSGITHLYLKQQYDGKEIIGSLSNYNLKAGEISFMGDKFFTAIDEKVNTIQAQISATQALQKVMETHQLDGPIPAILETSNEGSHKTTFDKGTLAHHDITTRLVFVEGDEGLRLCWEVNLYEKSCMHTWGSYVDALNKEILMEHDHTLHCSFGPSGTHAGKAKKKYQSAKILLKQNAMPVVSANSYTVYAYPTESPSHGARTEEISPWDDAGDAGSLGWHDDGTTEYTHTKGNNVDAYEDHNGNNSPTGGDFARADGGMDLEFDFPIDLDEAPDDDPDPYITNLFYWNNLMHDVWYHYGFDEASGNFQNDNQGRGGTGSDWVNAEAQDGAGLNNATFTTLPDGIPGRMQMFLWTAPAGGGPQLDGDLDNGIIAHEYGHGISKRLTGGPSNTNCLTNAEHMGEGWSDFFGLWMTTEIGDNHDDSRGVGTYALGQDTDGVGIRTAPYTTDVSVNSYNYANLGTGDIDAVHERGFLWCTMIWDLNWALINEHGYDSDFYNGTGGNNIMAQLMMDGMKSQPCSPGFVDARDAIIEADEDNNDGANKNIIWNVFAQRNLGYSANQGSPNNINDQTPAFDLPPAVPIIPRDQLFGLGALPVELTAFDAVAEDEKQRINLFWATASETNNKGFDLQRHAEGESEFESIAWLDGKIESTTYANYSYNDETVKPGVIYYYRIRQVDLDAKENYSEVVAASLRGVVSDIEVFPNPTSGLSTIQMSNNIKGKVEMKVLNAQGQVIAVELFETGGNAELEVDLSQQPEGVYFLKFDLDGEQIVKQILKRN